MGFITGSAGLQAMALQEAGDIVAKGVNWLSIHVAKRPPTARFPYGYGKLQFLSSLVMGLLLSSGATLFIFFNVSHINDNRVEPPSLFALAAAVILGVTGELLYRIMDCAGRKTNNMAILAAAMDNRLDALSSLAVLVGALLSNLGWYMADHIAALAVAVLVIRVGGIIVVEAVHGLLDVGPPVEVMAIVRMSCLEVEGIMAIKNVRGRQLGDQYEFDVSLFVSGEVKVFETARLKQAVSDSICRHIIHTDHVHVSLYPVIPEPAPPETEA